ncbi:hypothetical protein [Mobilicoccus pelagius]|uniref:D-inositol 3-phosphate glycosyltransferase n=1 Tax=Mobilicoccus pelagius NBRC 104925 TaxID=1089455 RepID=H5UNQ7_9MICO|nr:hypothetical protein [Mobilicoccus pelagius]GAB47365.1 hypothetical protein MOPEL_009_00550 [Mobilicoccus pelagius NBRC 104925]
MRATTTGTARLQHIPAGHGYALSVSPGGVLRPDPPVPGAPAGQWWPHPALEPAWVHAADVDLVHLHFGFEHRTPAQMRAWVEALRAERIGLVVTVHDLVNPHLGPDARYDELLSVVVPAADAVTTLTPGAAHEIARRWGRESVVHPHPHVVDEAYLDAPRPAHDTWVVGVHAKSLRASFDVPTLVRARDAVAALADAGAPVSLRLHVHEDVLDPAHPRHDPRLAPLLAAPHVDARIHGPLDDDALWGDLLDVDLALLPYRFGTHSGWLEMTHDLGTDVLVSTAGHASEQRPVRTYDPVSASSIGVEIARAHRDHGTDIRPARPARAARVREREDVRALHARLYRDVRLRVCGDAPGGPR